MKPTGVVELRFCAADRKCTRTGRLSRQAPLRGGHEVTACERVMGQGDIVNSSWGVASAELTRSVLMIVSTLNTMRTSERHTSRSLSAIFGARNACPVERQVRRRLEHWQPGELEPEICMPYLYGRGGHTPA